MKNIKLNPVAMVGAALLVVGIILFFAVNMILGGVVMGVGLAVAITGIVMSIMNPPGES